jgi:hypothetical protein
MITEWTGAGDLLPPDDAARALGVSRWVLNRLRREEHLSAVRVGGAWRYEPTAIQTFITRHRSVHDQ